MMIHNRFSRTRPGLLPGLLLFILYFAGLTAAYAQESEWTLPPDEAIRAVLAERMAHNGVGIVVGVIDSAGQRVVSYGRSGAHDNRPLDGDTIFQIGSVSKGVASLLLADMATRGEVGLDDPASMYLPQGVNMPERGGQPITLRHLATHMSGLPSMPANFDLKGYPDPYDAYTIEELHSFLSTYTLEYMPGEQRAYSNLAVALMGRLLANHMGTDYETLLKERVLKPLKMDSTSIRLNDDQRSRLAPGHDTYLKPVRTWEMRILQASGSLRSSANDMLKLIAAYLGYTDTPLKEAMARQIWGRPLALGWGVSADGTVSHSGGKQGYRSGVVFNLHTGIGAVVLANARTYDRPIELARYLVTGKPLEPALPAPEDKPRVDLPPAVLDSYAGRYRFPDGRELEVARNGALLVIRYPGNAILEFIATSPRDFFYNTGNDDILFVLDSNGQTTGLILYGDGKTAGNGELAARISG